MTQLRIALTLPGEASLGTFQAGAVSALIVAVQRLNETRMNDVRVDVMTGTSSGSLTAVLAAHALLTCQDPVDPLRRAWVTEPTMAALRGRDERAPLTLDRAREVADDLLSRRLPGSLPAGAQTYPIRVNFALTSLRGMTYNVERYEARYGTGANGQSKPMRATTHLDWAQHRLRARDTDWQAVVDSAIASASHPAAFPPALLDRSGERDAYTTNGVEHFPECPVLWYADGGLLDREPLGRCIRLSRLEDRDDTNCERVVLLLRPEPDVELESDDPAWTENDEQPSWRTTLARSLRIVVTHSLYEDLRRVERVNSRIAWSNRVADILSQHVPDIAPNRRALAAAIVEMRAEKRDLRAARREADDTPKGNTHELLQQLLGEATGLAGKRQIQVDVVSAPSAASVAGGSLLNFGGFLAERLRANDFLVGYMAMVGWMRSRPDKVFKGAPLQAAEARVTDIPGWVGGLAGKRRLSWRDRAEVARIAGRAARIGLRGGPARRV